MVATYSTEMAITIYRISRCHVSEELNLEPLPFSSF